MFVFHVVPWTVTSRRRTHACHSLSYLRGSTLSLSNSRNSRYFHKQINGIQFWSIYLIPGTVLGMKNKKDK